MRPISSLVEFYARHLRALAVACTALTVVGLWSASHLTLEADLERLLPETAPSVQGMRKLEAAYGPIGRLTLVLEGDDPTSLQKALHDLSVDAGQIDHVTRVEFERPVEFFETNRLLYIEYEDLETLSKRIKKRLRWEKQRANPLFADIGDKEPPSVDMSDIEEKYESTQSTDRFIRSKDGRKYLLFLYFDFGPGDLGQSGRSIRQIEDWATEKLKKHPDVTLEMTGRYKKRVDQTAMLEADLQVATMAAFAVLILFLLLYFRSFMAPILVVFPLLVGTVWAFAWAQIVFGSLNILTGFFGAVLLGLGIDYGIHLMSRYLEARRGGETTQEALATTLASAGKASVFAGVTTVIAFGSLAVSHFRAFHEYGIIALGGMTLIILAQIVVLPLLLLMVSGTPLEPKASVRPAFLEKMVLPPNFRVILIGALSLLALISALFIGNSSFEFDFQKVFSTDLPSWHLDEEVDAILDLPQIPAVILADDLDHSQRIASELRRRTNEVPEGRTIRTTMTLADVLPERQSEKRELLEELRGRFNRLPKSVVLTDDRMVSFRKELDNILNAAPITPRDLPENVRRPFARIDQTNATTVLAFPAIELHDAREMAEFAVVIRNLPEGADGNRVDAISESLLMVDIMNFVRSDSTFMVLITLFGLLLTALLAFRNVRRIAILVGTLATSIFIALGMVALFEIHFNFVNVLILPIWLGLGVDAAFHLMMRAEESPGDLSGFIGTAAAVGAAFGTSMIGFGAMMITNHNGLYSLGAIAVIGLGTILFVSLLIQTIVFIGNSRRVE